MVSCLTCDKHNCSTHYGDAIVSVLNLSALGVLSALTINTHFATMGERRNLPTHWQFDHWNYGCHSLTAVYHGIEFSVKNPTCISFIYINLFWVQFPSMALCADYDLKQASELGLSNFNISFCRMFQPGYLQYAKFTNSQSLKLNYLCIRVQSVLVEIYLPVSK